MKQILTDRTALAIHSHGDAVHIERHSWLGKRSKRMPDAVNVAVFSADELRPLATELLALAERFEKAAGK